MIRLRRPSKAEIDARLSLPDVSFSYPEVGSTATSTTLDAIGPHYDVDRHRFRLGTGRDLYAVARKSLLAWRQFELPWLELHGAEAQPSTGQVVATLTPYLGLWFLNPCQVVYTELADDAVNQTAFAYGTLSGHVAFGEERFAVGFDPPTQQVVYEILAFSRPAIVLSKIGYLWIRRIQKRFARSSAEALARACQLDSVPECLEPDPATAA